jgi:hypothetical protein
MAGMVLAVRRARAWTSFLMASFYLATAHAVLSVARRLAKVGLVGTDELGTALRWSEILTRTAMQIWHDSRARRWRGR